MLSTGARLARRMSIMRAARGHDIARRTELVEKLKELSRKARQNAAVQLPARPGPASGPSAVVPMDGGPPPAPPSEDASEYSGRSMALVLEDLEKGAAIHTETMKVIEGSQEWKDYDSHISFEMLMLKHRYQTSSDYAMTTARRAQLQAHLRAKQQAVMEQHAEMAARAFLESMTSGERTALKGRLLRIDAPTGKNAEARRSRPEAATAALQQLDKAKPTASLGSGADDDVALRDALWQLSKDVCQAATSSPRASVGKAANAPGAPAAGRTLRDLETEAAALRRLQRPAPSGFDSDGSGSN